MNGKKSFSIWLVLSLFAAVCSAGEPAIQTLKAAAGAAYGEIPAPGPAARAAAKEDDSFPKPDAATLARLARRIPGLDTQNLRLVTFEDADATLGKAANAKDTYLDLFTAAYLRSGGGRQYYLPKDVLNRLGKKYAVEGLPVSGSTKDGKPFQMEDLVAGNGQVNFLYDLTGGFSFMEGKNEVKISEEGRVAYQIQGAGDFTVSGLSGCGCIAFLCGCAEVQRMTKTSASQMRVETSRGPQTEALLPIRLNK